MHRRISRSGPGRVCIRYSGEGAEHFDYDFAYLAKAMEHVYQVLEGLIVYLAETHGQNEEWEDILNSY